MSRIGSGSTSRMEWIDALRFVAFVAVVVLHVVWIETRTLDAHGLVTSATRFAVPVFFIVSGYLIGRSDRGAGAVIAGAFRRFLPLFLFWEIVYNVVNVWVLSLDYPPPPSNVGELMRWVAVTVYGGGVAFHLWFLVWLGVSTVVVVGLLRAGRKVAWAGAIALFLVGLAIGPYGEFTGAIDHVGFLTNRPLSFTARNGPFFGPLFLMIGHAFAKGSIRVPVSASIAAILCGLAMQTGEGVFISQHGQKAVANYDILAGTPLFAVGVFLLFAEFPANAARRVLAKFGRLSLGMYCLHALFAIPYVVHHSPEMRAQTPLWVLLSVAAVIVTASAGSAFLMARVPGLRRFVT